MFAEVIDKVQYLHGEKSAEISAWTRWMWYGYNNCYLKIFHTVTHVESICNFFRSNWIFLHHVQHIFFHFCCSYSHWSSWSLNVDGYFVSFFSLGTWRLGMASPYMKRTSQSIVQSQVHIWNASRRLIAIHDREPHWQKFNYTIKNTKRNQLSKRENDKSRDIINNVRNPRSNKWCFPYLH